MPKHCLLYAGTALLGAGLSLASSAAILRSLAEPIAQTPQPAVTSPRSHAGQQSVTIRFQAQVGNQPFRCSQSYPLGTEATSMGIADFRFYVSDLALINDRGEAVPLKLQQDQRWQHQSVALLDFEDKTGFCKNGTTVMRDRVVGTVPPGKYRGLKLMLGVPFALNHGDATLAPSPLNLTALWWNWRGGYKFLRLDLAQVTGQAAPAGQGGHGGHGGYGGHGSKDQGKLIRVAGGGAHGGGHGGGTHGGSAGFPIHVGSTGCGAGAMAIAPTACTNPNRPQVVFAAFNPQTQTVVADVQTLLAATNLTQNTPNTPPGCMSSPEDSDCGGIWRGLGLAFGNQAATTQQFFRVR